MLAAFHDGGFACLCDSKTGGFPVETVGFYDDFTEGLSSERFYCLLEKQCVVLGGCDGDGDGDTAWMCIRGSESNVDIVQDYVDGVGEKNVVRLTAVSDGTAVSSTGLIQTAGLFTAGTFQVTARFPPVPGVVSSVWGFHFEQHFESEASQDPQYLPELNTHGMTLTNHEIDMEIPASCSGMCPGGGCPEQYDTMNLNSYRYTNAEGERPAYANLCVRAPAGTSFADGAYHTYTFEWHTGDDDASCAPHINFYFDDDYIGSINVFVPTRGVRLVMGIWGGDTNWYVPWRYGRRTGP